LFKKMAIADRLAQFVNEIYARPLEYQAPALFVATIFFAFQIYCDFSGYSDIAIGTAQILGIDLRTNFRRPYLSTSIAEFWTRWHVSLCSWFRDYVYVPLGGNRVTRLQWLRNVFVTFLLSGLWHGPSWTFVAWGCLNAVFLLIGVLTKPIRDDLWSRLGFDINSTLIQTSRRVTTFGLISVTWILFRAETFGDAFHILERLLDFRHWAALSEVTAYGLLPAYGACVICSLVLVEAFQRAWDGDPDSAFGGIRSPVSQTFCAATAASGRRSTPTPACASSARIPGSAPPHSSPRSPPTSRASPATSMTWRGPSGSRSGWAALRRTRSRGPTGSTTRLRSGR